MFMNDLLEIDTKSSLFICFDRVLAISTENYKTKAVEKAVESVHNFSDNVRNSKYIKRICSYIFWRRI